jgi:hypothetical protein
MVCSDEDRGRSRRPDAEDWDGHTGRYTVAERSRGRGALCAVYTVHVETRCTSFLVEP